MLARLAATALILLAACRDARPATLPANQADPTPLPPATLAVRAEEAASPPAPTITPSLTERLAAPRTRLYAGELQLAADVDDIPAIFAEDSLFVDAAAGSREWSDEEQVIGLSLAADARAYPVRLLSNHEIVNDTVGGQAVAVTWCPLCYSAIVFDRVVERELTFGVSGFLYRNNLVMYDHQSNTLWSQLLGQGIKGAFRGANLRVLPSILTTWGEWKRGYPDTRILSAERLGQRVEEIVDPYAGYYDSNIAGLVEPANQSELLAPKVLVVGLTADGAAKAFPLAAVEEAGVLNERVGQLPVLLVYDDRHATAAVYHRQLEGQTLLFALVADGRLQDVDSGSTWSVATGQAVDGHWQGARLQRLAGPLVYWFAWYDLHPEGKLYAPDP